ncbi:MAG TPA: hypothetical protein VID26_09785 [Candidatus Limnocylindrales bacterium]
MSDTAAGGHDPAHHGQDDHGQDDHGHGEEALGPIDITMWGVGILGVALGLLVAICAAFATGVFQAAVPLPF